MCWELGSWKGISSTLQIWSHTQRTKEGKYCAHWGLKPSRNFRITGVAPIRSIYLDPAKILCIVAWTKLYSLSLAVPLWWGPAFLASSFAQLICFQISTLGRFILLGSYLRAIWRRHKVWSLQAPQWDPTQDALGIHTRCLMHHACKRR